MALGLGIKVMSMVVRHWKKKCKKIQVDASTSAARKARMQTALQVQTPPVFRSRRRCIDLRNNEDMLV